MSETTPPPAVKHSVRVALRWHPGLGTDKAMLLSVRLETAIAGTELHVQHCGSQARGDQAAARRELYNSGWQIALAAFAARAGKELAA